jgi:hypothetical protein
MTKPMGIKREILKVDPQAGYLRLALWVISLFIIWSLLAYIYSLANPLPTYPDLWPVAANNADNLAADLWQDILSNYFSTFTLLNLAIVLLLAKTAFSATAHFLARSLQLSDSRSAQRFLRSCLFSLQDYPLLDTSDSDFLNSDIWKILSGIGGPCYLLLEQDSAVLTEDHNGYAQVVFPKAEEDHIVFFQQGEKAIQVLPNHPIPFTLKIHGSNISNHTIDWRNLRMTCEIDYDKNYFQADALRRFSSVADCSLEKQLENALELETRTFLLNCSSTDLREAFGLKKPSGIQTINTKPVNHRAHRTTHHGRLYPTPGQFFQWQKQGGFLRRRRRSLLPELHLAPIREHTPEPPALDFKAEICEYLIGVFKTIYNIPINMEIENIGEIQFNGEN